MVGLTAEVGHGLGMTAAAAGSALVARIVVAMIAAVPGPVRKAVMVVTPVVTAGLPVPESVMTVVAAASRPRVLACPSPASRTR